MECACFNHIPVPRIVPDRRSFLRRRRLLFQSFQLFVSDGRVELFEQRFGFTESLAGRQLARLPAVDGDFGWHVH